jgi:hypothetical protein
MGYKSSNETMFMNYEEYKPHEEMKHCDLKQCPHNIEA